MANIRDIYIETISKVSTDVVDDVEFHKLFIGMLASIDTCVCNIEVYLDLNDGNGTKKCGESKAAYANAISSISSIYGIQMEDVYKAERAFLGGIANNLDFTSGYLIYIVVSYGKILITHSKIGVNLFNSLMKERMSLLPYAKMPLDGNDDETVILGKFYFAVWKVNFLRTDGIGRTILNVDNAYHLEVYEGMYCVEYWKSGFKVIGSNKTEWVYSTSNYIINVKYVD